VSARLYRFRSEEDPSTPPDPAVCAAAPFEPNVRLGATLWADGDGVDEDSEEDETRFGTATACTRVTDPAFPPGTRLPFYAVFDLAEGRVTASGDATVVSNDVPVAGLVLAACHLRVIEAPPGFTGGAATSLSVFNPAGLTGFNTGSFWTILLFD
jgi:hypothetical protein